MEFTLTSSKTYATKDNVRKAVLKAGFQELQHFIVKDGESGRYFPVFLGERALRQGVHFYFTVVG